jgi:hypothetical protein
MGFHTKPNWTAPLCRMPAFIRISCKHRHCICHRRACPGGAVTDSYNGPDLRRQFLRCRFAACKCVFKQSLLLLNRLYLFVVVRGSFALLLRWPLQAVTAEERERCLEEVRYVWLRLGPARLKNLRPPDSVDERPGWFDCDHERPSRAAEQCPTPGGDHDHFHYRIE